MASTAVQTKLKFFYDVASPYSWVAFEVLTRYKARWSLDLELCPFFLGGIMKETGNRPPAMVPAKGKHLATDLERIAEYTGVPLKHPSDFFGTIVEKGTLQSQRFLTAVKLQDPSLLEAVTRELWTRIWNKDEDVTQPESLRDAARVAGLSNESVGKLLTSYTQQVTKDKLKETTAEAIQHGAFGAPIIVVQKDGKDHMFFGSDRFELLAWFIGKKWEGPLRDLATSKL